MRRCIALVLALAPLAGCSAPSSDSSSEGGVVLVARCGDLKLSVQEVDGALLSLPASERPAPGADLDAWYREQIRHLVTDRLLEQKARQAGLEKSSPFLELEQEARKQLTVGLGVQAEKPDLEQVSEEDLREAYEKAESSALSAPERRSVFHIFLRVDASHSRDQRREEIAALRDRVLAGESFQRLVVEVSDSESRHRKGQLGWLVPGELPPALEKVVFRLEEGVPSEPVATTDGLHLFFVDQILPARTLPFEEARRPLTQRIQSSRRAALMQDLEAEISIPEPSLVLTQPAFQEVARAQDLEAVVLRLGDFSLTWGELRQRFLQQRSRADDALGAGGSGSATETPWQLLEQIRRRELFFQHYRESGLVPAEALNSRMETWRKHALQRGQRQSDLLDLAKRDESQLRRFYEGNRGFFSHPPRWHLDRLRIELGRGSRQTMAQLEQAARTGSSSPNQLQQLQQRLGGTIDDLGSRDLAELRRIEPKLAALVPSLHEGQLSAPFRTEKFLEIVQVRARTDAEPIAFEEVRDHVTEAYVGQNANQLYRELEEQLLQEHPLEILPQGLEALKSGGLPLPQISPEQLEALAEEL